MIERGKKIMSKSKKSPDTADCSTHSWYPRNLIIHEEGKKILDEANFPMYLLEIFYRSGYINTEVYMACKKHFKEEENQTMLEKKADSEITKEEADATVISKIKAGRKAKELDELEQYFGLVEQGKMTVQAACDKLGIGRSTYYRRHRKFCEYKG